METLLRNEEFQSKSEFSAAGSQSSRYAAALIAASVILYILLVIYHIAPYHYNLSSLIRVGSANPFYYPPALEKGIVVFTDPQDGGVGYDGQYYYYMIKDLLMGEDGLQNPFRFQRILYPLLVYAVALGRPGLIPFSMLLVNLLAIALSAFLLWKLMSESRLRAEWLLIYTLNVGFLIAVFYDVATPLCVALIAASAYFYARDRLWPASAMMALSLLAQENGMVVLGAMGLWLLLRKNLRGAVILGLAVVPWAAWQAFLWARYDDFPFIMSGNHFRPPLAGMISQVASLNLAQNWQDILREVSVYPMMFFVLALLLVSAMEMKKKPDAFMLVLLVHGLIGVCFNREQIWSSTITSSARALAGVFPFLLICYAQNRSHRLLFLIVLSALLSLMGIARIILMPAHPFSVV